MKRGKTLLADELIILAKAHFKKNFDLAGLGPDRKRITFVITKSGPNAICTFYVPGEQSPDGKEIAQILLNRTTGDILNYAVSN